MTSVAIRGPIRPSKRTYVRHPDQLGLPLPRPAAREIVWEPGDPLYERPEPGDPDPRPAVLADQDPQRDAWRPLHETGTASGGPAAGGRATPGRASTAAGPPRRRTLIDPDT